MMCPDVHDLTAHRAIMPMPRVHRSAREQGDVGGH